MPFIGQLLELAGFTDTTMSVKHLMSLIVMFPTTFVHGLMSSDPLFPSETDDIARLGDSDGDPWAAGIGMTCAVVQTIWALNDMAVDAAKVNGVDAPGFCDYIDIAAPIIQTILGWPGDPDSNNKTQPPFVGNVPTGKLSQLLPWMILTSVIPPAASILFKLLGDPDAKARKDEDSFAGWYSPFILGVSGGANTILSSIYAWGTDATGDVKAEGILGNLSYVFAFLATQTLAEWSTGGPFPLWWSSTRSAIVAPASAWPRTAATSTPNDPRREMAAPTYQTTGRSPLSSRFPGREGTSAVRRPLPIPFSCNQIRVGLVIATRARAPDLPTLVSSAQLEPKP